eukprot:1166235-Pyramimonas_sp.AAC.1
MLVHHGCQDVHFVRHAGMHQELHMHGHHVRLRGTSVGSARTAIICMFMISSIEEKHAVPVATSISTSSMCEKPLRLPATPYLHPSDQPVSVVLPSIPRLRPDEPHEGRSLRCVKCEKEDLGRDGVVSHVADQPGEVGSFVVQGVNMHGSGVNVGLYATPDEADAGSSG